MLYAFKQVVGVLTPSHNSGVRTEREKGDEFEEAACHCRALGGKRDRKRKKRGGKGRERGMIKTGEMRAME